MEEEQGTFFNKKSENKNLFLFSRILESEEEINKVIQKYPDKILDKLHCSGCMNKCVLSESLCGKGKGAANQIVNIM